MNYRDFNDYELISHIRDNIEEANDILFEKYKPLIENNARKLLKTSKKNGIEFYDLVQEGMVGLNNALNTFDENKEASFYTYAKKCIERKQLSYVIGSERKKHKLLNESISYNINENDEINDMPKILIDNSQNPENMMLDTENSNELTNKIKSLLTPFEREVFELKINGFTYIEISEKLHKDKKAIDNAIQRIKTKIKDNLDY
jgi:RNA polymerase sporulation-specific sigma factor